MKSFKIEEERMLRANMMQNDLYWKKELYKPNIADSVWQSVFPNRKAYTRYHNLMMNKVRKESLRNKVSVEAIIKEIKNRPLYRNTFAKDPKKQNLYDNVQYENIVNFVKSLNEEHPTLKFNLHNCRKENRIVISKNGKIFNSIGKEIDTYNSSKPFDYYLEIVDEKNKSYYIYIISSYCHESGGSQNDRMRAIQTLHKYCKENKDKNVFFLFLLDGGYFKKRLMNIRTEGNFYRSVHFEFKNSVEKILIYNNITTV